VKYTYESRTKPIGDWEVLAPSKILKPAGLAAIGPDAQFPGRSHGPLRVLRMGQKDPRIAAWSFDSGAPTEAEARKAGVKAWRNLIPKSKVHYSTPYVHDAPLFVDFAGGSIEVAPPAKRTRAKAKGPTVTQKKDAARRLFFDALSHLLRATRWDKLKITGTKGKYRLHLPFEDRRLGVQGIPLGDLSDVEGMLAKTIEKLEIGPHEELEMH